MSVRLLAPSGIVKGSTVNFPDGSSTTVDQAGGVSCPNNFVNNLLNYGWIYDATDNSNTSQAASKADSAALASSVATSKVNSLTVPESTASSKGDSGGASASSANSAATSAGLASSQADSSAVSVSANISTLTSRRTSASH